MLDIRFPIGLMFSIVGLIILIYGLATMGHDPMYARSLNVNINLISGIGTLAFGLLMLLFSDPVRKRRKKQ
ncbi:MAG: hypothetical protein H6545_09660 [Bacteroidales bacterium]|jgi:hypothetical protein|nr:hypothetical protein [Bacteroidales bacterium]MCB9029361.1 hypothetical protein [Bacteroidales bacterium]MDD3735677.1 hypothetical protein [Bacteroidales bacterium]NLD63864.1 hypothetical protein [Bacteroidales bacterium]HNT92198.1 hypothetical protein [Bacteroidales bacterium]